MRTGRSTKRLFSQIGRSWLTPDEKLAAASRAASGPLATGEVKIQRTLTFSVSIGVVDSGGFKGEGAVEALAASTQAMLDRYVELARRLGVPADARMAIGTDVVEEGEKLCLAIARDYPRVTFFAGKIIFQRERWWQRLLHNETAIAIQRRLQWAGRTMVIMPARVR